MGEYKCAWCGRPFVKRFYWRRHEDFHMCQDLRPFENITWSRVYPHEDNLEQLKAMKKREKNQLIKSEIEKFSAVLGLVQERILTLNTLIIQPDRIEDEDSGNFKVEHAHLTAFASLLVDTIDHLTRSLNVIEWNLDV
jgi:hypothetical protein